MIADPAIAEAVLTATVDLVAAETGEDAPTIRARVTLAGGTVDACARELSRAFAGLRWRSAGSPGVRSHQEVDGIIQRLLEAAAAPAVVGEVRWARMPGGVAYPLWPVTIGGVEHGTCPTREGCLRVIDVRRLGGSEEDIRAAYAADADRLG